MLYYLIIFSNFAVKFFLNTLTSFLFFFLFHVNVKFLSDLQHYQLDADGLCSQLTIPVPKKGNPEVCVDTKAFEDAGWVIASHDLQLGDVLGKGEFGGA
jgi:hypothetical protein